MDILMTKDLASTFSFVGKRDKDSFMDYPTVKICVCGK
jgi:hypothetical protein